MARRTDGITVKEFGSIGTYAMPRTDLSALSVKNEKGETLVISHKEVRDVIKDILYDELDSFTEEKIDEYKSKIENRFNERFKQIENSLMKHVSDKIDKLSETIIEKVVERVLKLEVDKRVSDKWDEIKKQL